MRYRKMQKVVLGCSLALASTLAGHEARSGAATTPREVTPNSDAHGLASVYGDIPADQVEFLSTAAAIKSAAASAPPTLVWEALEHGEKVECLDCIPAVAPLLYDANAKTREIAAWWLRRRVFGVFGSGEVYERTVQTLASDADPDPTHVRRLRARRVLRGPGIEACARAITHDADARVRAAAASALGRLNDDGAGALGVALDGRRPHRQARSARRSRPNQRVLQLVGRRGARRRSERGRTPARHRGARRAPRERRGRRGGGGRAK